jgi:hypothetical protein
MMAKFIVPLASLAVGLSVGYFLGISRDPGAPAAAPGLATAKPTDQRPSALAPAAPPELAAIPADPTAALAQTLDSPEGERMAALRRLVAHWVKPLLDPKAAEFLERSLKMMAGKAHELQSLAGQLDHPELAAHRRAMLEAFRDRPGRASLFPTLASLEPGATPESMAQLAQAWQPWERAAFEAKSLMTWASLRPKEAIAWLRAHPEKATKDLLATSVAMAAERDPAIAEEILKTSASPEERIAAVRALIGQKAEDTRAAVAWADGLPPGPERDAAHEHLYEMTPRGVGAMLAQSSEGLPVVQSVFPGGPLARSGFTTGDLLAGFEAPDGTWTGFAGFEIESVTAKLRGDPGTSITVVSYRKNASTGRWEERRSPVTREQLVLVKQG